MIIGNYVHSTYSSFTVKYDIILRITSCLFSEQILCKENIVIINDLSMRFFTVSTCSKSRLESMQSHCKKMRATILLFLIDVCIRTIQ